MKRFREDYEAPGLLRTIAQWMNDVGRFLNGINVVGNGHIEENARGSVTITVGRAGLSGGGGNNTEGDYAFKVAAVEKLDDNGNPYDPPKYNVRVLGGPAQVLGGVEKVFDDLIDAEATEGDYVYVQYYMWSNINVAICEWAPTIIIDAEPPFDEIGGPGVPKTLVFCIAKIGAEYINNVNQYRLGAIQAVAVLNASPEHDAYHTIEIPCDEPEGET